MTRTSPTRPVVLTTAGFDPSGGAGIIADIRTIESFGCTPVAAITSITFQNANRFAGAVHQSSASLRAQIESILAEHEIAAVKIGMLPTAEVVREVSRLNNFSVSLSEKLLIIRGMITHRVIIRNRFWPSRNI